MNIDRELKRVEDLIAQAERIKANLMEAAETTAKILTVCETLGVDVVGISKKSKLLKSSMSHPFGADGSLFCEGNDKDNWPLAWAVVRMAGVSAGCGNPGQHQMKGGTKVLDGVYRCENGQWEKVE